MLQEREGLDAIAHGQDFITFQVEPRHHERPRRWVVFHHKNRGWARHSNARSSWRDSHPDLGTATLAESFRSTPTARESTRRDPGCRSARSPNSGCVAMPAGRRATSTRESQAGWSSWCLQSQRISERKGSLAVGMLACFIGKRAAKPDTTGLLSKTAASVYSSSVVGSSIHTLRRL